jgi:muconate cycloisomerase/chloromuconate cycloisomerase
MDKIEIESIEAVIVDLPLRRLQRFSALGTETQSVVIIFVRSTDGAIGCGESVTPSGPWWSGESVESIKLHIDTYLAPVLIGEDAFQLDKLMHNMDLKVYGNQFAKAGLEMALLDLIGKTLNQPVHNLLGGKVRESLPVLWPLATGDPEQEIAEAEEKIDRRLHRVFKLKMGAMDPAKDVARACKIAKALSGKARIRVDPNERWTESVANWAIERMQDAGIELVEQPLPRWDHAGSARLTRRFRAEIMIDEGMCCLRDMLQIADQRAAGTVSLKIMKSGGMRATKTIGEVARSAGISLYMGTFLESSYGTAANMQLCATLEDLPFGGELAGPLLIAEDICETPAQYRDFELWLADGVGMAANIDREKLKAFRRDRNYSVHALAGDAR